MASRGARQTVMLESTAGTGFRYYTTKNKRITVEKLKLRKYPGKNRKQSFAPKYCPLDGMGE